MKAQATSVISTILIALFWPSPAIADFAPVTLTDFDRPAQPGLDWVAIQGSAISQVRVPPEVQHEGVRGNMVRAVAPEAAKIAPPRTFPRPNYEQATAIRFRAKADGVSADNPLVIEFQVYSNERAAWFWRKITIDNPGWQTMELPLRYFRQSPGAVLDWREASRFAIHFRNAGTLSIDNFELLLSDDEHPAYLTADELGQFAFGDDALYFRSKFFTVVTDEPRLDGKAVLSELDKLYGHVANDLPALPPPARPVIVLIFAQQQAYQVFWRDLGVRFNSVAPVVTSGGYTLFGVAGSYYSDRYGAVRPVYVQEACHALLAQLLGVANQSEWLHEGIANYYQLRWSQQDIDQLTRGMIERGTHVPLAKLLNGRAISEQNYAQAVLFVKWLIEDPTRRQQLQFALAAMKQRSSTNLGPLAEKHFAMPLAEMEKSWLRWARERHNDKN